MNELTKRILTGSVYILLLVACVSINQYTFLLFFLLINALALIEFYDLSEFKKVRPQKFLGVVTGSYVLFSNYFFANYPVDNDIFLPVIPLIALIFILELFRQKPMPLFNLAVTLMGVLYISVPLSVFNYFVFLSNGYQSSIIFGFFILIWTYDTGAYVFGKWLGRTKMMPKISPKKTWEGLAGGAVSSLVAAAVYARFNADLKLQNWLIIAGIVVIAGTFGDLIESMMKRNVKRKDSGSILPGHGGMLDRFDSILLAAPIVYFYLDLLGY